MIVELYESARADKKWTAYFPLLNKTIHFGAKNYQDFTTHKDPERRDRYIKRHQARENWSDPVSPGFWSRWLLWNKPTLKESARDIEKKFNIQIRWL